MGRWTVVRDPLAAFFGLMVKIDHQNFRSSEKYGFIFFDMFFSAF